MIDNLYIDESKLIRHVAILSPSEMLLMFSWPIEDIMRYISDKAHCNMQQVYRVSWLDDDVTGFREYVLDVDPTRIIREDDLATRHS